MIIFTTILLAVAIVLAFVPTGWACVVAYVGLLLMGVATPLEVPGATLWFWGFAALFGLAIGIMARPKRFEGRGTAYVTTATLAGALVGMLVGSAGLIVGACVGAFCGALAFSNVPRGRQLRFPSSDFVQYLCSQGLPAVVTMCIVGLGIAALINFQEGTV